MTTAPRELSPAELLEIAEKLADIAAAGGIQPINIVLAMDLSAAKFNLAGTPVEVWLKLVQAVYAGVSGKAGFRSDAVARLAEAVAAHVPGNADLNRLVFQLGRGVQQRVAGTRGIFLSYASANRADVDQLYVALQGANPQADIFQDHRSIALGQNWLNVIRDNAGSAALMVCWVTTAYLKSAFCNYEIGLAESRGTTLIPVFAEPGISSQASAYLTQPQGLKVTGPLDFADLASKILAVLK